MTAENPCFSCGGCCRTLRVSFYHAEAERLPDPSLVVQLTPFLVCMKGTEQGKASGGCVALRHTPEEGYRCSIYESRPSPCREFNILEEDGSENPTCRRLRLQGPLSVSAAPDALT